ncbi:MAG: phage minor capsid protein, partial [Firmicutes bacterium]|nr:phage minor capsid protein [Bacillota bacterium]
MLTERQMITLPAPIVNKFISLETDVIKMIASRIKAIAELDTEDSYKLAIIKNIDNDLEYINNQLNDILAGIKDEIHEIYSKAIESEYNDFLSDIAEKIVLLLPLISVLPFANIIAIVSSIISTSALPFRRKSSEMPLDTRSMLQRIKDRVFPPGIEEEPTVEKRSIFQRLRDFIFPFRRNDEIQTAINIVTDETTNHIKNITETIGFLNVNNEFKSLHEFYVDILNKAVTNIYEGKETFYNEMRKTIRIIADRGLTHVEYESGRRLRLDTAVRTALNGGR